MLPKMCPTALSLAACAISGEDAVSHQSGGPHDIVYAGKEGCYERLVGGAQKEAWASYISYDMREELAEASFLQLYRRCIQVIGGVDTSTRNAAFQSWHASRLSWVTPGILPDEQGTQSAHSCALALTDANSKLDGKLSQLIKSGVLQADPTARVLVAALVQKADRLTRGYQRPGSSRVEGVDATLLREVLFRLWRGMSKTEALQTFGLSKNCVSTRKLLQLDFLPKFFCPSPEVLLSNCSLALGHLSVLDTRNYMLTFDDTVTGS